MTRSVLFAVILAVGAIGASGGTSPAWAQAQQEKKGIFSFFNRQSAQGNQSDPIHMTPGTAGASKSETKAYGFGKNTKASSRYEDSPVNAENARSKAAMAQWLDQEKARGLAEGAALNEQIRAQNAYNAQQAKQREAQIMAQNPNMGAGKPPSSMNNAASQALRAQQTRTQGIQNTPAQGPNGMIVPPASSRVQGAGNATPQNIQRPARPQGLFNRVDDED